MNRECPISKVLESMKSEAQISKHETSTNNQNKKSKTPVMRSSKKFCAFENWDFEFVSDLGFRISDLKWADALRYDYKGEI